MGVATNTTPSAAKIRGGYYTPKVIAEWLAKQVDGPEIMRVLEPSAGDGALVAALLPHLASEAEVDAVECDRDEARKLESDWGSDRRLHTHVGDVFAWFNATGRQSNYDLVIGNPPYIRYQHWPADQSVAAFELMHREGLHPSRLTNAWVPFVVLSTVALRPGGQLALVLPAELLQVGYAGELRHYLSDQYEDIRLVTFEELVFPGILQETVLLIARKRNTGTDVARIRTVEVLNASELPHTSLVMREADVAILDHSADKWIKYLLTAREVDFLRECSRHPSLVRLGEIADVDVGIVTGRNEVFVLTPSAAREAGIEDYCVPLVGRSAHVPGVAIRPADWRQLYDDNARVLLLDLPAVPFQQLSGAAQQYVGLAETANHHTGYKCRIRLPHWWGLRSTWAPDAFLLRQIYDGPRLIANSADATCTDTLHKVRFKNVSGDAVAVNAHNSVTWALAEVRGRSYGGGVLELEPSEAEALLLPSSTKRSALHVDELDDIIRRKGNASGVDEVNARVLVAECGWTRSDVNLARDISQKLAGRRRGRKALKAAAGPR